VVIESDDWGSTGVPSRDAVSKLEAEGIILNGYADRYLKFDGLESEEDLSILFDALTSVKDQWGKYPMFTALCVVSNPDFKKMREADFEQYVGESANESARRLHGNPSLTELWLNGKSENLFFPQFHGREHLNASAWMKAVRSGQPKTRFAFDHGTYGIDPLRFGESKVDYRAAFDIESMAELDFLREVISGGIRLFRDLLSFSPRYFVPTNGPFNLSLESSLKEHGIHYLTLDKLQKEPLGHGKYRMRFRYLGKRSANGLTCLSRNAAFEPGENREDVVDRCLCDMKRAFRWKKPVTISTHRVNYMGTLNEQNRTKGITLLKELLKKIVSHWPEVEFMTSEQLGKLILDEERKKGA
jgi:hypothetical protein